MHESGILWFWSWSVDDHRWLHHNLTVSKIIFAFFLFVSHNVFIFFFFFSRFVRFVRFVQIFFDLSNWKEGFLLTLEYPIIYLYILCFFKTSWFAFHPFFFVFFYEGSRNFDVVFFSVFLDNRIDSCLWNVYILFHMTILMSFNYSYRCHSWTVFL